MLRRRTERVSFHRYENKGENKGEYKGDGKMRGEWEGESAGSSWGGSSARSGWSVVMPVVTSGSQPLLGCAEWGFVLDVSASLPHQK